MWYDFLLDFGYLGLFVVSFVSASLFPLASEALVVWMPSQGFDTGWVLATATAGNTLGALANYYVGKAGAGFVRARFMQPDSKNMQRARELFQRWGAPVLLLSWVPIIGDPLTAVAGVFELSLSRFIPLVVLGKLGRYAALLGLAALLFSGR